MAFAAADIAGTATVDRFAAETVGLVVVPAVVAAVVPEELADYSSCSIGCRIADYTGRPGFAFAVRPMVVGAVVAFAAAVGVAAVAVVEAVAVVLVGLVGVDLVGPDRLPCMCKGSFPDHSNLGTAGIVLLTL